MGATRGQALHVQIIVAVELLDPLHHGLEVIELMAVDKASAIEIRADLRISPIDWHRVAKNAVISFSVVYPGWLEFSNAMVNL